MSPKFFKIDEYTQPMNNENNLESNSEALFGFTQSTQAMVTKDYVEETMMNTPVIKKDDKKKSFLKRIVSFGKSDEPKNPPKVSESNGATKNDVFPRKRQFSKTSLGGGRKKDKQQKTSASDDNDLLMSDQGAISKTHEVVYKVEKAKPMFESLGLNRPVSSVDLNSAKLSKKQLNKKRTGSYSSLCDVTRRSSFLKCRKIVKKYQFGSFSSFSYNNDDSNKSKVSGQSAWKSLKTNIIKKANSFKSFSRRSSLNKQFKASSKRLSNKINLLQAVTNDPRPPIAPAASSLTMRPDQYNRDDPAMQAQNIKSQTLNLPFSVPDEDGKKRSSCVFLKPMGSSLSRGTTSSYKRRSMLSSNSMFVNDDHDLNTNYTSNLNSSNSSINTIMCTSCGESVSILMNESCITPLSSRLMQSNIILDSEPRNEKSSKEISIVDNFENLVPPTPFKYIDCNKDTKSDIDSQRLDYEESNETENRDLSNNNYKEDNNDVEAKESTEELLPASIEEGPDLTECTQPCRTEENQKIPTTISVQPDSVKVNDKETLDSKDANDANTKKDMVEILSAPIEESDFTECTQPCRNDDASLAIPTVTIQNDACNNRTISTVVSAQSDSVKVVPETCGFEDYPTEVNSLDVVQETPEKYQLNKKPVSTFEAVPCTETQEHGFDAADKENIPANKPTTPSVCVVTSGLTAAEEKLVGMFLKQMNGKKVSSIEEGKATHLIISTVPNHNDIAKRTLKYFYAVLSHVWIVNFNWIKESLKADSLLPEEKYEIRGDAVCKIHDAPKRSRLDVGGVTKLFSGLYLCLLVDLPLLESRTFIELVRKGGGTGFSCPQDLELHVQTYEPEASKNWRRRYIIVDPLKTSVNDCKAVCCTFYARAVGVDWFYNCMSIYRRFSITKEYDVYTPSRA